MHAPANWRADEDSGVQDRVGPLTSRIGLKQDESPPCFGVHPITLECTP